MESVILAAAEEAKEALNNSQPRELNDLQLALIGGGSADVFCQ